MDSAILHTVFTESKMYRMEDAQTPTLLRGSSYRILCISLTSYNIELLFVCLLCSLLCNRSLPLIALIRILNKHVRTCLACGPWYICSLKTKIFWNFVTSATGYWEFCHNRIWSHCHTQGHCQVLNISMRHTLKMLKQRTYRIDFMESEKDFNDKIFYYF